MLKRSMSNKIFLLGELNGAPRSIRRPQDFYVLRDKHLEEGTLFEDQWFPADDSSLYFSKKNSGVIWKRPKEMCSEPKLFRDGHSRMDAIQGGYSNCWVIASVANLADHERLLHFVIPSDQGFDEKYAGIFHFRFWQYGRWVDVVVDDRLPYNTAKGKLFSLRSRQCDEFWSALVEKAYAKLHGCYEALNYGYALDAMQDFTGGITEVCRFKDDPGNVYEALRKAYEKSALISCSFRYNEKLQLQNGHAYSITGVRYVHDKDTSEKIPLIRVRNPWGLHEWKGDWSDRSDKWQSISEEERKELNLTIRQEGEFWMSYEDFDRNYIRVEVCYLTPLPNYELQVDSLSNNWQVSFFEGKWVKDVTAGGRSCFKSTFCHNPQYRVVVTEPDEGKTDCTLLIGLLQKFRRQQKHLGVKNLEIAFEVYRLEDPNAAPTPLDISSLSSCQAVVSSPDHEVLREFSRRLQVPPGTYCIVPCTHEPNQEGEFLIRVFTEQKHIFEEHDDEIDYDPSSIEQQVTKQCSTLEETVKEDQATALFTKYSGDTASITWNKLKILLDTVLKSDKPAVNFSRDCCKSLLAMLDIDRSGELSLEEFRILWTDIKHWKTIFQLCDEDKSGTLNSFELRKALNSVGFRVNARILSLLMQRYANQNGQLELEDFIAAAVKLKTMLTLFKEVDHYNNGRMTFTLEQWIESTVYA